MSLLDVKRLSQWLGIKPGTLYLWANQGRIPCLRIHGLLRFNVEDINEWLVSCRHDCNPPPPKVSSPRRQVDADVDALIVRAKREVYNRPQRGNQTTIKPQQKGGANGAV